MEQMRYACKMKCNDNVMRSRLLLLLPLYTYVVHKKDWNLNYITERFSIRVAASHNQIYMLFLYFASGVARNVILGCGVGTHLVKK